MAPDQPPQGHSWRIAAIAVGLSAIALVAIIVWWALGGGESLTGSGY
jgi:hypothetical protein